MKGEKRTRVKSNIEGERSHLNPEHRSDRFCCCVAAPNAREGKEPSCNFKHSGQPAQVSQRQRGGRRRGGEWKGRRGGGRKERKSKDSDGCRRGIRRRAPRTRPMYSAPHRMCIFNRQLALAQMDALATPLRAVAPRNNLRGSFASLHNVPSRRGFIA